YWAAPPHGSGGPPPRPAPPVAGHPLLGVRRHLAEQPEHIVFEAELARGQSQLLDEHRGVGTPPMPASGFMEMAWAAAGAALGSDRASLVDLTFHRPLTLPEQGHRTVQTSLRPDGSGGYAFRVYSSDGSDEAGRAPAWSLHASATL